MNDLGFHLRQLRQLVIRKLRTALQGPPSHPEFVRAAHYFSDGWALNVLQVISPARVLGELRAIQDDGFNSVILVVPWRGFQQDQLHPSYDVFYERQLRRVLSAADRLGLSVIVRVAYSNQVFVHSHVSGITQAQRLLTDEETRQAWLDYLQRVYRICHGYRCFRHGFLSWEEFWHAFAHWQLREPRPRGEIAVSSGYLDYLAQRDIRHITEIPRVEDPAHESFHAFTNHRIREIYELACGAFPGLGMEFRVDKEPIGQGQERRWVENDDYADRTELRYSYWAPFMGAENTGEKLSAERAAQLLDFMLDQVSHQGRCKAHIVDQLNFVDETPSFKGVHAEISESDIPEFLSRAAPLLKDKAAGYGIWAYRDYRQNVLFNARFLMGLAGWQVPRGQARVGRAGGVKLGKGAVLRQYLPAPVSGLQRRVGFTSLKLWLSLARQSLGRSLQVRINAAPWTSLDLDSHVAEHIVEIPADFGSVMADGLILELRNSGGPLEMESLSLYHWVFRGGVRLEDGSPARHHQAIVDFNRALERGAPDQIA